MSALKHKYLFFTFIFLFISFYNNHSFIENDRISEALVIGRLIESEKSGIFSHSGLTGYITDSEHIDDYNYNASLQFEFLANTKKSTSFPLYKSYDSHSGGQAMLYGIFNKISPFGLETNIKILKSFNIGLVCLLFTFLVLFVKRNFGNIPSIIALLFLASSSWISSFSSSLYWSLWVFYLPFIVGLRFLENHPNLTSKNENKLFILLYLTIVLKCFISGFEYILTTFIVGFIPIVYYFILFKKTTLQLLRIGLKYLLLFTFSILTSLIILVFQIKQFKGSYSSGIEHVFETLSKRTANVIIEGKTAEITQNQYFQILLKYLNGDMFSWTSIKIPFITMILVILACCCILQITNSKKNKAIVFTTLFSILAPLSWYLVFIQHSAIHLHLNYIVWYIPFLPLGYICIGLVVQHFIQRFKKSKI